MTACRNLAAQRASSSSSRRANLVVALVVLAAATGAASATGQPEEEAHARTLLTSNVTSNKCYTKYVKPCPKAPKNPAKCVTIGDCSGGGAATVTVKSKACFGKDVKFITAAYIDKDGKPACAKGGQRYPLEFEAKCGTKLILNAYGHQWALEKPSDTIAEYCRPEYYKSDHRPYACKTCGGGAAFTFDVKCAGGGRCYGGKGKKGVCSEGSTYNDKCICTPKWKPATHVCRPAKGPCDKEETCTGNSAHCPDDYYKPADTPCRPKEGDCDKADFCSGRSTECYDKVEPYTTVCRPKAHPCDKEDYCDGKTKTCGPDMCLYEKPHNKTEPYPI